VKSIVTILLISLHFFAQAQEISPYLKNFGATVYQTDVYLEWTTRAGFSCEDVVVEHGLDTLSFLPVYTWPGICGNQSSEVRYLVTLESLNAGRNYFRLDLGLSGKSPIIFADIQPASHTAKVIPNPADNQSALYWNNTKNQMFNVIIFNNSGDVIYEQTSTESRLPFQDISLLPGLYHYLLYSPDHLYKGRFLFH
jgi:hypothetical protein